VKEHIITSKQVCNLLSAEHPRVYVQEVLALCGLNPRCYWLALAPDYDGWRIVKRDVSGLDDETPVLLAWMIWQSRDRTVAWVENIFCPHR
jgi:hypothetical protein